MAFSPTWINASYRHVSHDANIPVSMSVTGCFPTRHLRNRRFADMSFPQHMFSGLIRKGLAKSGIDDWQNDWQLGMLILGKSHYRVERCNCPVSIKTLDFAQVRTFYQRDRSWIAGGGVKGGWSLASPDAVPVWWQDPNATCGRST